MNRTILNLIVSGVTAAVSLVAGYLLEFSMMRTASVASVLGLVTFSALAFACRREDAPGGKRRNMFLLAGAGFAIVGTLFLLEPYLAGPEDLSWRGYPVILFVLAALHLLIAFKYRRPGE